MPRGTHGVVITHPHPLYGGDMDNPVVAAIRLAFRRQGFTTLRFSFRGVGESAGRQGRGVDERHDVHAAIAHLQALGVTEVDLAGYSFGSWVNAGVESGFRRMVMVAPPVAFMRFEDGLRLPRLSLVVGGDRDDFAPVLPLQTACRQWNPQAALEIIPGADHFSAAPGAPWKTGSPRTFSAPRLPFLLFAAEAGRPNSAAAFPFRVQNHQ